MDLARANPSRLAALGDWMARDAAADRAGARASVALGLLCASALVYLPLLVPGRAPFSPYSDIPAFHVGIKDLLSRGLARGALPLWRGDQMLGGPALTQPQTLFLHPLQLPFLFMAPAHAFGPCMVLELWIGALGAYALARTLGTSLAAGILAAIAQLVCFKLILACYAGWSSPLATLVMLPWIVKAVLDCAQRPSFGTWLGASCTFAVSFAGASPQTPYYALLLLCGYPLLAQPNTSADRLAVLRRFGCLGLALATGLACNAYLWLPIWADLPLLTRSDRSYAFFLSGHALGLRDLATALYPELFGTPIDRSYRPLELWENTAYFGLAPLCFVLLVALRLRQSSRAARYLLGAFALGTWLSLESPLLRAVHAVVPGYALFRMPARMLFVTAVLGIALFALGFDAVRTQLATRRPRLAHWLAPALALAMLSEGSYYARRYLSSVEASQLEPAADHPARGLGSDRGLRVAAVRRASLNYGWASSLGIELVNGYDPYLFAHVRDYCALIETSVHKPRGATNWLDLRQLERPDLLRDLSVGYVLASAPLETPTLQLESDRPSVRGFALYRGATARRLLVYKLDQPRPRARFATRTLRVASQAAMARWLERNVSSGEGLVLGVPADAELGAPAPEDTLEELGRSPGHIALRVRSQRRRLVLLAEAYHPGWRATIDRAPARVQQANLALLGLFVPAGQHEIRLDFVPVHFELGAAISALALALLGAAALARARLTRKLPARASITTPGAA